jgi:hypothetical protein
MKHIIKRGGDSANSLSDNSLSDNSLSGNSLLLYQPMNILVFLTLHSPIIVSIFIACLFLIYQNFRGVLYYIFSLNFFCFVRSYVYSTTGSEKTNGPEKTNICNVVKYTQYGNPTFSAFIFAFTIMYLSFPMFSNNAPNYWVFCSLIAFFLVDMFTKIYKNCIVNMSDLFLNVLLGLASAALIVTLMYVGGEGKYLFFNELSSTKEICYKPSEQTFKCSLYKNGELISAIE